MKNLKEDNKAEYKLKVGSLEVLGDVTGSGIQTIRRKINAVEQSVSTVIEKTNNYWKAIATDNIITPDEKKNLKRDWNQIDQTYAALMEIAEEKAQEESVPVQELTAAYEDLKDYIFIQTKLFDDMTTNTEVESSIVFNSKFSTFYDKQYKAQSFLTEGTMGYQDFQFAEGTIDTYPTSDADWYEAPPVIPYNKYLWFRTRWTNEEGSGTWTYSRIKGDSGPKVLALYSRDAKTNWHEVFSSFQDRFMKLSYDQGESWTDPMKIIGEDGSYAYCGIVENNEALPDAKEGNYFLAGADFTVNSIIVVNGKALLVNGSYLTAPRFIEKGWIYALESGSWQKIEDRNDFRYVISINDLIETGAQVSPGIQATVRNNQPMYLGIFNHDPEGLPGDWFTYNGPDIPAEDPKYERKTSYVYKYTQNEDGTYSWTVLNPTNSDNYSYYMQALPDVLTAKQADLTNGYFATVFANALVANTAFIKKLSSQIITLQEGESSSGILKSSNYDDQNPTKGFKIDTEGNAFFMGDTVIAGEQVEVTNGIISARSFSIKNIKPGNIILRKYQNIKSNEYKIIYSQICGDGIVRMNFNNIVWNQEPDPEDKYPFYDHVKSIVITDSYDQEHEIVRVKNNTNRSIDIPIKEGISIKIELPYLVEPILDYLITCDIEIATDKENGVLAYLGETKLEKIKPSPIR